MSQVSSQSSDQSLPEINLSQGTLNHLLEAVGMSGGCNGNMFTNCYTADFQDETVGDILDQEPVGSSSISVRKAVFHQTGDNCVTPWNDNLTQPFSSQQAVTFGNSVLQSNRSPTPQSMTHSLGPSPEVVSSTFYQPSSSGGYENEESPLIHPSNPIISPYSLQPSTHLSPMVQEGTVPDTCSSLLMSNKSTIPLNTSFAGDYGFMVIPESSGKKKNKITNFYYSPMVQRAYIKQGLTIPFYFKVTCTPPQESIIRAMAIHTAPEMIGDNLTCCPNHEDENQKKGLTFPKHFIRPQQHDANSLFCNDSINNRLSIATPFSALQKENDSCYTALYVFPCYTSDFSRIGQFVQIIFTLECGSEVLGRCTLDIRVCASPSRDRNVDEEKKKKEGLNETTEASRNGRKRGPNVEVTKCVLPPKKLCQGLSRERVSYTIKTYPEIIPFIEVCVKMMEKVHSVPTAIARQSSSHEKTFESVESWLSHLGLSKYLKTLEKHGISEVFQVLSITDEELKKWGMKTKVHRDKFLEGKDLIRDEYLENSPDVLSQTPSDPPNSSSQQTEPGSSQNSTTNGQTLSQTSVRKSIHVSQSFEVVEITMKKNLSSSSTSSSI